jgi:hypothetical protein
MLTLIAAIDEFKGEWRALGAGRTRRRHGANRTSWRRLSMIFSR